jgi:hypothetical protein
LAPDHPEKKAAGTARDELDKLRAALDSRAAASGDRHHELETVRMQIEAARIAASAHGNVVKEARAALRAERLAGATLRRLVADLEQRIADMEHKLASLANGPDAEMELLKRARADIARAWNEAEARLERTNRDWSLEVERIRHSVATAEAQTLARYGQLLQASARAHYDDRPRSGESSAQPRLTGGPRSEPSTQAEAHVLPPAAQVEALVMPSPLMREADRRPFHEQVQVQVNGEAALLVDLSVRGAQVVSRNVLKPNRAVKILLPVADKPLACRGQVVWARLEPSVAPGSMRYRAGMLFTNPDIIAIQGFMTGHTAVTDAPATVITPPHRV